MVWGVIQCQLMMPRRLLVDNIDKGVGNVR